jgi:hypothetical protein
MNEIKKITKSIKSDLRISILTSLTIIIGFILKIIFPINKKILGKHLYLAGIPFIRENFLFFPFIIISLLLFQLVTIYNNNNIIKARYSLFKYLKKTNFGFLFSNLILILILYIFIQIYIAFNNESSFKISEHVATVTFTGIIYNNIRIICKALFAKNKKLKSLHFIDIACIVLLFHNLYANIWTVWVSHTLSEVVISLVVSVLPVLAITFVNIDRLVIKLFDAPSREREINRII